MLISWIKQFIRVSTKGKFYTIVNTIGLAFGLACTMVIVLWADYQKSYDKFHDDYQKIYKVYEVQTYSNGYNLYTFSTPGPLAPFLNTKFAEISNAVRFDNASAIFGIGDKVFRNDDLGFTDSTFFKVFKVVFLSGNPSTCLREKNSIVLTVDLAKKIFGNTDVIGKNVQANGNIELKITAIIENYPKNSDVFFSCLIPFEKIREFGRGGITRWGNNSHKTYVKLINTNNIKNLEKNIQVETKKMGVSETTNMFLQPLEKTRLYNIEPNGFGFITLIKILMMVSGFVLVLACINFVNLITARAANRAKEVGIRKVIGSTRSMLITQYFIESFINTIISLLLAILIVDLFLPTFNATLGTELKMSFVDFHYWSKILILIVVVGVLSSIYPALVLSSFQPAKVLKGILRSGAKGVGFRKAMVIIQYTITIFLVCVSFFLFKQMNYITNADFGMSRVNVLAIRYQPGMEKTYSTLKAELKQIPGIKYVTSSQMLPFRIGSSTSSIDWSGKDTTQQYLFSNNVTDENFTDVMGIKMVEGRYFSSQYPSDTLSVVINETAAKIINHKQLIGETMKIWQYKLRIIGIIKDFNFDHLSQKIQPLFLLYNPQFDGALLIKTENRLDDKSMNQIRQVFKKLYPDYPFESTLLEDEYQNRFAIERQLKSILGQFTILAIIISSIGLLSLAAFIAEQLRKSLVLRRIHGATFTQTTTMLLGNFTKWVVISGFIAIPLSYLTIRSIFKNYAFHTDYSWWLFAVSLLAALIIAVLTVLYQAFKTARVNPVDALRYE